MIRNLTRSRRLVPVTILKAVRKLNFLQMDQLWWMDHQLILDFYQCHLQGRTTALVVLLLQLLNGPICRLIARSNTKKAVSCVFKAQKKQTNYIYCNIYLPAYQIPKIDMACLPRQWQRC